MERDSTIFLRPIAPAALALQPQADMYPVTSSECINIWLNVIPRHFCRVLGQSVLALVCFLGVGLSTAWAEQSFVNEFGNTVSLNNQGMPYEISGSHGQKLNFSWNPNNYYTRDIYVTAGHKTLNFNTILPPDRNDYEGVTFGKRTVEAFDQIRRGGSSFRVEKTAEEFLAHYPIKAYTVEENRRLTNMYGMGFSAAIYRLKVESDPGNAAFASEFLERYRLLQEDQAESIGTRLANTKIMIAKGYVHGYGNMEGDPIVQFIDDMKLLGVETGSFNTNTAAPLTRNDYIIARETKEQLDAGQNVILFAASKGGGEVLGALAQLTAEGYFDQQVPGRGKIVGVILSAGLTQGSFVADLFASQRILMLALRPAISWFASKFGLKGFEFREGMSSLSTTSMKEYGRTRYGQLPQDIFYLNLLGLANGYGYSPVSMIGKLQKKFYSRKFFPKHGANDALIEYPNVGTSREQTPNSRQLIFESGHPVLNGSVLGIDINDPARRALVMATMLHMVADQAGDQFAQKPAPPGELSDLQKVRVGVLTSKTDGTIFRAQAPSCRELFAN